MTPVARVAGAPRIPGTASGSVRDGTAIPFSDVLKAASEPPAARGDSRHASAAQDVARRGKDLRPAERGTVLPPTIPVPAPVPAVPSAPGNANGGERLAVDQEGGRATASAYPHDRTFAMSGGRVDAGSARAVPGDRGTPDEPAHPTPMAGLERLGGTGEGRVAAVIAHPAREGTAVPTMHGPVRDLGGAFGPDSRRAGTAGEPSEVIPARKAVPAAHRVQASSGFGASLAPRESRGPSRPDGNPAKLEARGPEGNAAGAGAPNPSTGRARPADGSGFRDGVGRVGLKAARPPQLGASLSGRPGIEQVSAVTGWPSTRSAFRTALSTVRRGDRRHPADAGPALSPDRTGATLWPGALPAGRPDAAVGPRPAPPPATPRFHPPSEPPLRPPADLTRFETWLDRPGGSVQLSVVDNGLGLGLTIQGSMASVGQLLPAAQELREILRKAEGSEHDEPSPDNRRRSGFTAQPGGTP